MEDFIAIGKDINEPDSQVGLRHPRMDWPYPHLACVLAAVAFGT